MGGSQSKKTQGDASSAVERYLAEEALKEALHFKVLLLGAGESGKTTVVRQLRAVHKLTLEDHELRVTAKGLHRNTLQSIQCILAAAQRFDIPFDDPTLTGYADRVMAMPVEAADVQLTPTDANNISALWASDTVQKAWALRSQYWHLDSCPYYFDNVHRFTEDGFVPNEDDTILCRIKTTGVLVTEILAPPVTFTVVDVGGQRSERRKWIHHMDDVKALLFIVNLAGYNQVMYEDEKKNRMHEDLELFEQTVNNPVFERASVFLIFNKKDLFEQMLRTTDMSVCFPDYTGGQDMQQALDFVRIKFESKLVGRPVRTEFVAARYKKDIRYGWEMVRNTLLEEHKRTISGVQKQQKRNASSNSVNLSNGATSEASSGGLGGESDSDRSSFDGDGASPSMSSSPPLSSSSGSPGRSKRKFFKKTSSTTPKATRRK